MSFEPNIASGDSGDYVTNLQERLRQLGYYEGSVDGTYGPTTETAVQLFQEATGLEQDGQVQEATWQALEQHEAQHGGGYEEPAAEADQSGRQLSEDGQWWWDGTDWKAVDGAQAADAGMIQDSGQPEVQLSPDGQYQWDGSQWLPVGGATAMVGFALDGQAGEADAGLPQPQAGPLGTADQSGHPGLKSASTANALTGFETGLADLLPEHMEILDGIVEDLMANPLNGGYVTLSGSADRRGDQAKNQTLGQQRAEVVRDYLVQRIDDEETKQAIRAYSLGAPDDGPQGDQPDLRKVDIAITRRSLQLPQPHPTDPLPQGPQYKLPERPPVLWPAQPPYPWLPVPQVPPNPAFIPQLSRWLNQTLHTHDFAEAGGDIAGIFGLDPASVRNKLAEAFQSGGEAAAKAVVKGIVDWIAGALSTPAPGPHQGPPDPTPFPSVPQSPEIKF